LLALSPASPAEAAPQCTSYAVYHGANVPSVGRGGSVNCQMGQGAQSEAVLYLQYTLNYCYNAGLSQDGDFGPRTRAALVSAQRSAGAAADGVYGPETRSKIMHRGAPPIFGCLRVP
jgi:peptidoglycan hydrolase-like protein with peptidoglycan-binding domain